MGFLSVSPSYHFSVIPPSLSLAAALFCLECFGQQGAHFFILFYIFYQFLQGVGGATGRGINISFCFLRPLAVISVTRSGVGCHLAADCSAVRNRSVGTPGPLMAAASQSAAHFHSRAPPSPHSQAPLVPPADDLSPGWMDELKRVSNESVSHFPFRLLLFMFQLLLLHLQLLLHFQQAALSVAVVCLASQEVTLSSPLNLLSPSLFLSLCFPCPL